MTEGFQAESRPDCGLDPAEAVLVGDGGDEVPLYMRMSQTLERIIVS